MKKVPLSTTIFFYLSIVSIVFFLIACAICNDILEEMICIFVCYPVTVILALVIMFMQISAIVNYFDAHKNKRDNKNKVPLLTVKFFYFSLTPVLLFLIVWVICILEGDQGGIFVGILFIFGPGIIFLAPVVMFLQIAAIMNYFDARKKARESIEEKSDN